MRSIWTLDRGEPAAPAPPFACAKSSIAWLAAIAIVLLALAANARPALAAIFHAHDGASLQAAVASADSSASPSTIELSAGTFRPTATLTLTGQIAIVGPSTPPGAKLDGGAVQPFPSDLLLVESRAKVTIRDLELTTAGGPGSGAAVEDFGTLDLESSTLAGNNGPGLLVQPGARAIVRDSTLSDGLGLGLVDLGSASLFSTTVAGNAGGGIDDANGALSLTNTIVAGDHSADCTAPARSSDHSLDGDGSCGVGALSRTGPQLGPLLLGGGPTPTHALSPGSPAVAAGDPATCPSADQRHFVRPTGRCDIGAYQTGAGPGARSEGTRGGPGQSVKSDRGPTRSRAGRRGGACVRARSRSRAGARSRHSATRWHRPPRRHSARRCACFVKRPGPGKFVTKLCGACVHAVKNQAGSSHVRLCPGR